VGEFVSKKILVADDSPTIRKMAESLLRKQGCEVLCAQDGASALEMARINKPDLIFLDVSLPVLDGHGVCQELKGNEELRDTPVIILGSKDGKKEEDWSRSGADGFMEKPFEPKQVLGKVQEFLKGEHVDLEEKTSTGSRDESLSEEEKPKIDKTDSSSPSPEMKEETDESLEILETSDYVENFEASFCGPDGREQHEFDWFLSELKKEMEETRHPDFGVKRQPRDKAGLPETTSSARQDLLRKDKAKKENKVRPIEKDQRGSGDLASEFKSELIEGQGEKSLDDRILLTDYDQITQRLIERISTKIAQEVARNLDFEILKQMVRDEVEKLRKEPTEAD
jgi:twitching motility two-component system response regulator PilG